jgi:hypothetical protein
VSKFKITFVLQCALIRVLLDKDAHVFQTFTSLRLRRGLVWNFLVETDLIVSTQYHIFFFDSSSVNGHTFTDFCIQQKKSLLILQNKFHHFNDKTHSEITISIHSSNDDKRSQPEISAEFASVHQVNFALNVHPLISKQISKLEGVMELGSEVAFLHKNFPHLCFTSFGLRYFKFCGL